MCIYRLISPSGKSYVGQARDYIDRQKNRIYDYQRWLKIKDDESFSDKERRGSNPRLFLAFLKYGVDNFRAEILEENIENQEKLDEIEDYYIDFYDCIEHGYNVTLGGNTGVNPFTGRSWTYGQSSYLANRTDDTNSYNKELYWAHHEKVLERRKELRVKHRDAEMKRHLRYRDTDNARRKQSCSFLRNADMYVFGNCDLARCFRRFFGGGRTRSFNFIKPKGILNEQFCWLFE